MANTYIKSDYHLIFRVKSTFGYVLNEDLPKLHAYLGGIVRGLGGVAWIVGGMPDHVHMLVSVPPTIALSDFIREIKAKSSKWMKSVAPCYTYFQWQSGYGAFTVSSSGMDKVKSYIENQEIHHKSKHYKDEIIALLLAHKVEFDDAYIED